MFDSHIDDLIEKRVMNDEQNVSFNSRSGLIKPPISRGLKDLIVHPPSSSSPSSTSSPLSPTLNRYGHSTANSSSNNSSSSSKSGTPLPTKRNTTTTSTNANSSSIKFANRRDQSLREVLDDWRTDFYPNLSYDHFYEGALKNSTTTTTTTTTSSSNNNDNDKDNNNNNNDEENNEDDEDSNSVNSNNSDNEDDSDSNNKDTKNNDAYTQYNEYINNLNDQKNNINNNQQESLLEKRVKQWKNDILLDIQQSSATFMDQLPHRIFEKSSNDNELPMSPSTKTEPSDNQQQQQSSTTGKSKFEMWRENFNTSMDEKMKEKKRTNKIIITSNKQ